MSPLSDITRQELCRGSNNLTNKCKFTSTSNFNAESSSSSRKRPNRPIIEPIPMVDLSECLDEMVVENISSDIKGMSSGNIQSL